ncbi:MAG TPA: response regulator [Pyrinomonadaceae bacterium]|nr:response regulator [Pyrinomonadaceae bacterium]
MQNSGNNRSRILIVDDESGIRDVPQQMLCVRHECSAVTSAEEALTLLAKEEFDLVLSDIRMSGRSGLEMIPHALKSAPDTVIMMISGQQTIDNAIQALRLGAFDYITKPFNIQHVEAEVDRALAHHSLLETKRRYENHLEELVRLVQVGTESYLIPPCWAGNLNLSLRCRANEPFKHPVNLGDIWMFQCVESHPRKQ